MQEFVNQSTFICSFVSFPLYFSNHNFLINFYKIKIYLGVFKQGLYGEKNL